MAILRSPKRGEVTRAAALTCGLVLLVGVMFLAVLRLTPKPLVNTLTVDGVRVQAQMWQAISPNSNFLMVTPSLTASRTPDPRQHWEIDITGVHLQWWPFQHRDMPFGMHTPLHHAGLTRGEISMGPAAPAGKRVSLYPVHRTYADIDAQLCRYETADERVTFHNVHFIRTAAGLWILSTPRPLSVTTPSGITVTMPPQPSTGYGTTSEEFSQISFTGWYKPGLHCWMQVSPDNNGPHALPASALYRTYHEPVTLQLLWPTAQLPLMSFYGVSSKSPTLGVAVPLPPPAGGMLKSLTFLVRQRVDVQTFPLSFTVPLETRAWPVFPKPVPQQHLRKGITL